METSRETFNSFLVSCHLFPPSLFLLPEVMGSSKEKKGEERKKERLLSESECLVGEEQQKT